MIHVLLNSWQRSSLKNEFTIYSFLEMQPNETEKEHPEQLKTATQVYCLEFIAIFSFSHSLNTATGCASTFKSGVSNFTWMYTFKVKPCLFSTPVRTCGMWFTASGLSLEESLWEDKPLPLEWMWRWLVWVLRKSLASFLLPGLSSMETFYAMGIKQVPWSTCGIVKC